MAGSSVAAMVVGTVFIMIFGMATVTLVDSVNESIKNTDYELPDPEVVIVSVTDKQESTGPIHFLTYSEPSVNNAGSGYTPGATQCDLVSSISGTGASVNVIANASGNVINFGVNLVSGTGYTDGETVTIDCGSNPNSADFTVGGIHDQNTISIRNTGSETVELSHVVITLSDTSPVQQGVPFQFTDHYTGGNLYLFPGEEISTEPFPLSLASHGFSADADPDRAFLAIYDYNDAVSVTIS